MSKRKAKTSDTQPSAEERAKLEEHVRMEKQAHANDAAAPAKVIHPPIEPDKGQLYEAHQDELRRHNAQIAKREKAG